MWENIVEIYKAYSGTGLTVILFLAAELYLFLTEKNKINRIVFVYVPAGVLLLFFCPLFASVVFYFTGDEIYYRILWLTPMVPVLAYAGVKLAAGQKGKKRVAAGVAAAVVCMLAGSLVYRSEFFSKAENRYHIPDVVVDLCDAIEVEGREVRAAFPMELLQYVRQYTAYVYMPYGREVLIDRWNMGDELYDLLLEESLNVERIVSAARDRECHYLIFSGEKQLDGSFEDYDFSLFDRIGGYVIYVDDTLYRGL